jgi:hypothetical protein
VDGDSEQETENASNEPEPVQNESVEDNTATEELDDKSLENEVNDGKDSQETDATEEKEG